MTTTSLEMLLDALDARRTARRRVWARWAHALTGCALVLGLIWAVSTWH